MLENVLESFSENVFLFLTREHKPKNSLIVKKHSEKLQFYGDFSFPNSVQPWYEFLGDLCFTVPEDTKMTLMQCVGHEDTGAGLVQASKDWTIPINSVKEEKGRIHLFLERNPAISVGLLESLNNIDIVSRKIHEGTDLVQIDPHSNDPNSITSLRLKCVTKAIHNLYAITSFCKEGASRVFVTYKSAYRGIKDKVVVLCAPVLNAKTGLKDTSVNAEDFIRIRQSEMTLIAQHKYGVRVTTDSKWKEFIDHLGESAVIFELLQTKPSCAVKINFDSSLTGSSKGAAFILYNCARLETILRTYNEKVKDGEYPPLPEFGDTDFTLLTQEDEWTLIFNFIMGFPSLLRNCVEISEQTCEFRTHLICSFLSSMVKVVSQYYRRTRILTEPRKHLLPVMFARIHMLKILNDTLKICLRILNIKSVSQM